MRGKCMTTLYNIISYRYKYPGYRELYDVLTPQIDILQKVIVS